MIHTQYYALLRALSQAIQRAAPNTKINQWDYNYNSKTFDSLKLHRNPLPYPKGIMNISNSQKLFTYPLSQNASLGTNAADIIQFPNAFPIAGVDNKFQIYGLTNKYNINIDVTLQFETGSQLLDFYHTYSEYFPTDGKYFYDFEYDYYLYLPEAVLEGFDPITDNAINIYAQEKDDADSYNMFAKCFSSPLIKCESVAMNQDKNSQTHTLSMNFNIQESFIYMIFKVDLNYWVKATSMVIDIRVEDLGDEYEHIEFEEKPIDGSGLPLFDQDKSEPSEADETNNNTTIKDAS